MEHHSPGTQIGPNCLAFRKALKSMAVLGCLAMVSGFYNSLLSLCKDGSATDHHNCFCFGIITDGFTFVYCSSLLLMDCCS